jgi:tRNA pseudouridine13 synthase
MIVKQSPDDFRVTERTEVTPGEDGRFALYRLEKQGWTTHDALGVVRRRWKIELRRLAYGGLKDKHAHTIQHFTINNGPRRDLQQQGIRVQFLGMVEEPFSSQQISANRFDLVLRGLSDDEAAWAQAQLPEVARCGVPNYFDDQRFGSVADEGPFLAKSLVLGQYEEALQLALLAPYRFDRPAQKKEKAILKQHWGDWQRCKALLGPSHARSLMDYLVKHPSDFRGAVSRLRPDLRSLYLSAYQSHLWNRMLAMWLTRHLPPEQLLPIELRLQTVPVHLGLSDEQRALLARTSLPLLSGRMKPEDAEPHRALIESVLAEESITLDQMKLRKLPDLFFSRGERAVLCLPAHLQHEFAPDESRTGRQKLVLTFDLPRGAYATLFVKRLTRPGQAKS